MLTLKYWLDSSDMPWQQYQPKINEIHEKLKNNEDDYTSWMDWPARVEQSLVQDI